MVFSAAGQDSSTSIGTRNITLITRGRKTGKPHAVRLKAVFYSGKVYFSRHRPDSDWYLNAAADSNVTIQLGEKYVACTASVVANPELLRLISELKYPGEGRAKEKRVAIEAAFNDDTAARQSGRHNKDAAIIYNQSP